MSSELASLRDEFEYAIRTAWAFGACHAKRHDCYPTPQEKVIQAIIENAMRSQAVVGLQDCYE